MGTGTFGIWHLLFMIAAYSSVLVCLYAVYRIAISEGWQWGLINLLILVLFLVLFWLMESWAGIRTPYFFYPLPPTSFPDWIPFYSWPAGTSTSLCELTTLPANTGIPLSVLLLEATLTFSAMHTAVLLTYKKLLFDRLLRPFMAAVALLALDVLLDPLASQSFSCSASNGMLSQGLGFWEWYVMPSLGPDAFGVPLFNYVLWYAAPVVLIALIGFIGWFYDLLFTPVTIVGGSIITVSFLFEGAFLALIIFAFTLIIVVSPNFAVLPIDLLWLLFATFLLLTLAVILWFVRRYDVDNDFRWWFVYPQAAFALFALIAWVGSGRMTLSPSLWFIVVFVLPLFVLWSVSPYLKKIWP